MREDQQFQAMGRGRVAEGALELLEEHLEALEGSVLNKIYSKLKSSLDPTEAVQLCAELGAYERLRKRLNTDRKKGLNASKELTETMEGNHAQEA